MKAYWIWIYGPNENTGFFNIMKWIKIELSDVIKKKDVI